MLCREPSPDENNQRFFPPEMRELLVPIQILFEISVEQKIARFLFHGNSNENLIRTRNTLFRVAKTPDSPLCSVFRNDPEYKR